VPTTSFASPSVARRLPSDGSSSPPSRIHRRRVRGGGGETSRLRRKASKSSSLTRNRGRLWADCEIRVGSLVTTSILGRGRGLRPVSTRHICGPTHLALLRCLKLASNECSEMVVQTPVEHASRHPFCPSWRPLSNPPRNRTSATQLHPHAASTAGLPLRSPRCLALSTPRSWVQMTAPHSCQKWAPRSLSETSLTTIPGAAATCLSTGSCDHTSTHPPGLGPTAPLGTPRPPLQHLSRLPLRHPSATLTDSPLTTPSVALPGTPEPALRRARWHPFQAPSRTPVATAIPNSLQHPSPDAFSMPLAHPSAHPVALPLARLEVPSDITSLICLVTLIRDGDL
jgi:hypothetical protein